MFAATVRASGSDSKVFNFSPNVSVRIPGAGCAMGFTRTANSHGVIEGLLVEADGAAQAQNVVLACMTEAMLARRDALKGGVKIEITAAGEEL